MLPRVSKVVVSTSGGCGDVDSCPVDVTGVIYDWGKLIVVAVSGAVFDDRGMIAVEVEVRSPEVASVFLS